MKATQAALSMRIVINPVDESPLTGLPMLIQNCTTDELEAQLQQIEKPTAKIRRRPPSSSKAALSVGSSPAT